MPYPTRRIQPRIEPVVAARETRDQLRVIAIIASLQSKLKRQGPEAIAAACETQDQELRLKFGPVEYEEYPAMVVIEPTCQHTHSIFLLHGRGDTGHKCRGEFMVALTSEGKKPGLLSI